MFIRVAGINYFALLRLPLRIGRNEPQNRDIIAIIISSCFPKRAKEAWFPDDGELFGIYLLHL